MDNNIHLKYLTISQADQKWGLTINSVGYQKILPNMTYPPSNHPVRYIFSVEKGRTLNEYQLLYIFKGKGKFSSRSAGNGRFQPVGGGNMFLLYPGEWHNYMPDSDSGWEEYWIGFQGDHIDYWIESGFFTPDKPIYNVGIRKEIVSLYEQAIQIAIEQKSGFQQILSGIVHYLMGLTYSYNKNYVFETSDVLDQIERAKILIAEKFRTIRPKEVAETLNMSYSNFRKIFKEFTGFAPAQYIQDIKLSKAKELLTNSTMPIKKIAYMMGFENHEYFFTAFRKKNGVTPTDYRHLTRGDSISFD